MLLGVLSTSGTQFYSRPKEHIFIDLPSIRCRNSTWKIDQDFIYFEMEMMASIRR